ncbi:MAG: hypothetical protein H7Y59_13000 [Anaerolineales bacterium]|nr:hypothetical protein [Anaerolineales bacterium]
MPVIVTEIFSFLGFLLSAIGLLVFGFAGGRFTLEAFQKSTSWQVQAALAVGLFALLAALTKFTSPGSAGAFALGAGIAFFLSGKKDKKEDEEVK